MPVAWKHVQICVCWCGVPQCNGGWGHGSLHEVGQLRSEPASALCQPTTTFQEVCVCVRVCVHVCVWCAFVQVDCIEISAVLVGTVALSHHLSRCECLVLHIWDHESASSAI